MAERLGLHLSVAWTRTRAWTHMRRVWRKSPGCIMPLRITWAGRLRDDGPEGDWDVLTTHNPTPRTRNRFRPLLLTGPNVPAFALAPTLHAIPAATCGDQAGFALAPFLISSMVLPTITGRLAQWLPRLIYTKTRASVPICPKWLSRGLAVLRSISASRNWGRESLQ